MKMQAYKIVATAIKDSDVLYKTLKTSPVQVDSDKWKYAIVELNQNNSYIYGLLGQEADELLFEYDDDKKRNDLDMYRWYETFFVIDVINANLYVHVYRYKPENLNHRTTVRRIGNLLSLVYFREYNEIAKLMPFREGINRSEFREIFYNNRILEVKFTKMQGRYIPEGTKLHNPSEVLDNIRRQSHNVYDADVLSDTLLKAAAGKNLSKSPTARSFLESGSDGDKIKYSKPSGEITTEHKEANAYLELKNIEEDATSESKFKKFVSFLNRNTDRIKKFKLFEDVDNILGIKGNSDDDEN